MYFLNFLLHTCLIYLFFHMVKQDTLGGIWTLILVVQYGTAIVAFKAKNICASTGEHASDKTKFAVHPLTSRFIRKLDNIFYEYALMQNGGE